MLLAGGEWRADFEAYQTPAQLLVAPLMIVAGIIATRAGKRYTGVVLVSVTGLGMVVLFATSGAPDLALTQILVETVTLVAFALVLRRIPSRLGEHNASVAPFARAFLGIAVGLTMALVALVATGARTATPISSEWTRLAYELGHGKNIVNVALVDLRGWDTMGELSVLIVAATGVASLVFVTHRVGHALGDDRSAAACRDRARGVRSSRPRTVCVRRRPTSGTARARGSSAGSGSHPRTARSSSR